VGGDGDFKNTFSLGFELSASIPTRFIQKTDGFPVIMPWVD